MSSTVLRAQPSSRRKKSWMATTATFTRSKSAVGRRPSSRRSGPPEGTPSTRLIEAAHGPRTTRGHFFASGLAEWHNWPHGKRGVSGTGSRRGYQHRSLFDLQRRVSLLAGGAEKVYERLPEPH